MRQPNVFLIVLLGAVGIALSGCGNYLPTRDTFEGRGDYRSGLINSTDRSDLSQAKMFFKASELTGEAAKRLFKKGDYVSIHLKRAYVGWFSEGLEEVLATSILKAATKGEIAVVANVTDGRLEVLVEPTSGSNPGKVIYYSGDVYQGQSLNFSMIPVYGPVPWSGSSIQMDFTVLELDGEERKALSGLLGALASLGTDPALKQAPLVGAALKNLGAALVQSNQDDVIGRYRFSLVPTPSNSVSLPVLQEGDLVLVSSARKEDPEKERRRPFRWDCFTYEHATGLLRSVRTEDGKRKEDCRGYLANNQVRYFVFSVLKNQGDKDQSPQTTLAEVYQQAAAKESSLERFGSTFSELLAQRTVWVQARENLGRLRSAKSSPTARELASAFLADILQCSTYRQMVDRKAPPWPNFAADVGQACDRGEAKSYLDTDQLDWLVAELAEDAFDPKLDLSREKLVGSNIATSTEKKGALAKVIASRKAQ